MVYSAEGIVCATVKFELLPDTLSQPQSEIKSNIRLIYLIDSSLVNLEKTFGFVDGFKCI